MDGNLRVDLLRLAAELLDRIAHCRQIDHAGDAGEILHQHARGAILDLAVAAALLLPIDDRLDVFGRHRLAVFEAQHVFEQHLHREGQPRDVTEFGGRLGERIIAVALAAGLEGIPGAERVVADRGHVRAFPCLPCRRARGGSRMLRGARRRGLRRAPESPRALARGRELGKGLGVVRSHRNDDDCYAP